MDLLLLSKPKFAEYADKVNEHLDNLGLPPYDELGVYDSQIHYEMEAGRKPEKLAQLIEANNEEGE
jgi:hypothetical protein